MSSCRFRTRLSLTISSLRLASATRMGRGASGGQFSWHCNSVRICFDGGIDSFGHMELVCVTFSSALGHQQCLCLEQILRSPTLLQKANSNDHKHSQLKPSYSDFTHFSLSNAWISKVVLKGLSRFRNAISMQWGIRESSKKANPSWAANLP